MKKSLEARLAYLRGKTPEVPPAPGYKLPYYALACVLLHVRSADGQNADLVFPMDEVPAGGMGDFLEDIQRKALEGGYRVLTDEEYISSAEETLAQRSGHMLTNAAQQLAQSRQVDEALGGEILRLHKGKEGGDA